MSQPKLFLWDHPASSFAQKVRIMLREKGLPFDKETPEGLGSGAPNPSLLKANPRMEVPALVDGDFSIFESSIILAYLEEKYPEPALLPKDPRARAEARLIENVCDTQYEGINWGIMEINGAERATGDLAEKILGNARSQVAEIHSWLLKYLGEKDYFNGDTFGYADLVVIPYVNRSFIYGMMPPDDHPLTKWRARCLERPAVQQTWEELREGAGKMADAFKTLFKPGAGRKREYRDSRLEFMIRAGGISVVNKGIEEDTIRFSWPGGI